jgi:hypothetical protein
MRLIFWTLIVALSSLPTFGGLPSIECDFTHLHDALRFLDRGLEMRDWNGLNLCFYPPIRPGEPNRAEWKQLDHDRDGKSLATMWADRDFPASSQTLVLNVPRGGLIGGSRIGFVKVSNHWCLHAVYFVR